MARHSLTKNGKWFDTDSAVEFCEDTRWNGNNHISRATGSQWDHQVLYYTAGGNWVLHCWSQYQHSEPTYEQIDEGQAISWLISQEAWDQEAEIAKLPPAVRKAIETGIANAEV